MSISEHASYKNNDRKFQTKVKYLRLTYDVKISQRSPGAIARLQSKALGQESVKRCDCFLSSKV
jgi:hypothetical protein